MRLKQSKDFLRVGLGTGISYGFLGTDIEFMPIDYFAFSGGMGIGLSGIGSPDWHLGVRTYPFKKDTGLNPRLSLYYGRLWDEVEDINHRSKVTSLVGYAFGPGIDFKFKNGMSIDFEWLYLKSHDFEELEDADPWKFSVGLGIHY